MRVVVDATTLDGRPSGARTRLLGLGRAHARRGDLEVLHLVRPGVESLPGLATRAFDGTSTPVGRWRAGRRLDALVRELGADLFHAAALPLPRTAAPLVATVHDLRFLEPSAGASRARRLWGRFAMPANLRRAERVVAVSRHTAEAVAHHGRIERSRVAVVPNAPSPDLAPVDDVDRLAAVRRALDLNARYALALGPLEPHKNLPFLLDVLAAGPADLALVVAGRADPDRAVTLARLAERRGLAGRVRVAGELDDAVLSAALSGADALVVPGFAEGFSIPAVDAQRFGVPVVAAAAGALPEVCGDEAWLASPDDPRAFAAALAAAVTRGPARDARVAAARERAGRWSWERSAAVLEELWTDVVLSRGKGPGS